MAFDAKEVGVSAKEVGVLPFLGGRNGVGGARAGVARVSEAPPPRRRVAHELRETAGGRGESEPEVPCELASYGTRTPASARLQPRRSNCASRGASELRLTLDCTVGCEFAKRWGVRIAVTVRIAQDLRIAR